MIVCLVIQAKCICGGESVDNAKLALLCSLMVTGAAIALRAFH